MTRAPLHPITMPSVHHLTDPAPPCPQEDERLDRVNEQLLLIQKKNGLTFGTDAFLLSAFVTPQPRCCAVDLGSGTGIVSLLLTVKKKIRRCYAVEIQPSYAELTGRNARANGLEEQVIPVCCDLRDLNAGDLPEMPRLIVSNPPYQKPGTGMTNRDAGKEIARHELFGGIEDFCACAGRLLQDGGHFVSVWRPERLTELFSSLHAHRLEPKRIVFVHADNHLPPCAVLTDAVRSAAPGLRVLPPLFLYEPLADGETCRTRKMTPEAEAVYRTCSFPEPSRRTAQKKKPII